MYISLALLNIEQDIVHKMDFTYIVDYSQLQKPGKDCFKCFVLRTCNFGFPFSSISGPKILLLSVQFEKNTPFPIFATFAFLKVIYEYN